MTRHFRLDFAKPYRGWCYWFGKAFSNGVTAHLEESRPCKILGRALVAEAEPDLQFAAKLLHAHADRICSDQFAQEHGLGDGFLHELFPPIHEHENHQQSETA